MRKLLLLGLVAGAALLSGCATVAMTPEQNLALQKQIYELDKLQMADDWNLIWLADRQSRLTRWHSR
jgi:uncharacterized protein YceK